MTHEKKILQYNKVLGIGFHKTGTTSLAAALTLLGFNNLRGFHMLRNLWGSTRCFRLLRDENYTPYLDILTEYDSVEDNPWYLLYKEIDERFPNSKFILTIREEQEWLNSCRHFFSDNSKPIHKIIYGVDRLPGNEELYLNRYKRHNEEVISYFADRSHQLLILDIKKGDCWKKLCHFLGKPVINLPFPHLNKKGDLNYPTN